MVCGPTGCSKTFFVKRFFRNMDAMNDTKFDRILFYYSEWQSIYTEYGNNVEFHEGLETTIMSTTHDQNLLLLMTLCAKHLTTLL